MAADTPLTSLNFNDSIIGKSFVDKKTGVKISFGYVSGLPPDLAEIAEQYSSIGLSLMENGMGQHELDQTCQSLISQCGVEDFDILITKSDLPFDVRWFVIGDLNAMLLAARSDRISLPFSDFLYDELQQVVDRYSRKS